MTLDGIVSGKITHGKLGGIGSRLQLACLGTTIPPPRLDILADLGLGGASLVDLVIIPSL